MNQSTTVKQQIDQTIKQEIMNTKISAFISFFAIVLLFTTAQPTMAQTDPNLTKEVEVVRAYQPTVTDAMKIYTTPRIVDTVSYIPTFSYQILSTGIPTDKTINQLPAVPIGSAPRAETNTAFIKVAGGNAFTPSAEFVLNTTPTTNSEFGMHLFHFYTNPRILLDNELKVRTPFSTNSATLFAKNYFKRAVLEWDAAYSRNRFNYYGFQHTDSLVYRANEPISPTLNTKQAFNEASTQFRLSNFNAKGKTDYNIALKYNYFWNLTGQNAHQAVYDGRYKYSMLKFDISTGTNFSFFRENNLENVYNNSNFHQYFYAAIDPQISFTGKLWEVKAGLNMAMIIDENTTNPFHISPKTYFSFTPIEGVISVFAGTDGKLNTNNYTQSLTTNPYLHYNTDLLPTETSLIVYGGLKGKLSRRISYLFDVSYSMIKDDLFYKTTINDYTNNLTIVNNLFTVDYYDINTLRFGGQIRYSASKFKLALTGNYYDYESATAPAITYRPAYDAALDLNFVITDRISASLGAKVVGARTALTQVNTFAIDPETGLYNAPVTTWETASLKTMIDTHIEINYQHTKKLSFFVTAHNIINQKNQVWHGYNNPGLLVMGGLRYTF